MAIQPAAATNSSTDDSELTLCLLTSFELSHAGAVVHVSPPAQRLLAFLAFQQRPVLRRAVAAALWADLDEQAAAARVRSALWRLPAPGGQRLVESTTGRMWLAPCVQVDVHLAADDEAVMTLTVGDLNGDLLEDWDEDWVTFERERVRQLRLHRLEQLSDRACAAGQFDLALQAALAAAAAEPMRESAHRRVMQAHLAEDNPSEALRQFELIRRLLRDELGLAPSRSTRALVAPLLGRPLDSWMEQAG